MGTPELSLKLDPYIEENLIIQLGKVAECLLIEASQKAFIKWTDCQFPLCVLPFSDELYMCVNKVVKFLWFCPNVHT